MKTINTYLKILDFRKGESYNSPSVVQLIDDILILDCCYTLYCTQRKLIKHHSKKSLTTIESQFVILL